MYIKINNLFNNFGQPDYKGLNINLFAPGSQIYGDTFGLFFTNEQIINFPTDVIEITVDEYTSEKSAIETKNKQNTQAITDRLSAVEMAVANMMGV